MPSDQNAAAVLEFHRQILAELDKSDADNERREKHANETLEECAATRKENAAKRHTLLAATRIYQEYTGTLPSESLPMDLPETPPATEAPQGSAQDRPKPRARIGEQRYRIFHALRQQYPGTVRVENLAFTTGLLTKRIRAQMREDILDGMAQEVADGEYKITFEGLDLMNRFETYKRAKGQPLPSLSGPIGDGEDGEEPEREEMAA